MAPAWKPSLCRLTNPTSDASRRQSISAVLSSPRCGLLPADTLCPSAETVVVAWTGRRGNSKNRRQQQ